MFAGQTVGIREVADRIWLVSFMDYDLGFFDENDDRVEPVGHNPFTTKVLKCYPCPRNKVLPVSAESTSDYMALHKPHPSDNTLFLCSFLRLSTNKSGVDIVLFTRLTYSGKC